MPSIRLRGKELELEGLPRLCIRCGDPAANTIRKRFHFFPDWCFWLIPLSAAVSSAIAFLSIVIFQVAPHASGLGIGFGIAFASRYRCLVLRVPVCATHRRHWLKRTFAIVIALPFFVILIPLIVSNVIKYDGVKSGWLSFNLIVAATILGLTLWICLWRFLKYRSIYPTEIVLTPVEERVIRLYGVAKPFVEALKAARPPSPKETALELETPPAQEKEQVSTLAFVDADHVVPIRQLHGMLGRFELREVLGEGSFGRVYRAFDPTLERIVALKVPTFPRDRPLLLQRFIQEAKSAGRLRHPNIVAVFETGQAQGHTYIASEFVAGQPLSALLQDDKPRPRQAAEWTRLLALALQYAHEEGVIHRDVKPANIMIDKRGRPQLMDFGLAKRWGTDDSAEVLDSSPTSAGMTMAGSILGTPAYMAPEQARGDAAATGPHSDQYSLGVVLFEMLTGERPFTGTSDELRHAVSDPYLEAQSPRRINPEVDQDLAAICRKALAKDPARRYGTLADMAVDLQRWLNEQPVSARPRPELAKPKKTLPPRVGYAQRVISIIAAIIIVLGLGVWRYVAVTQRLGQADQTIESSKQAALAQECDLWRERALRLRGEGKADEALLWLARAMCRAIELDDASRQTAIFDAAGQGAWKFTQELADAKAVAGWHLAGDMLLGVALSKDIDPENVGRSLPGATNGTLTAYAKGGQTVVTMKTPAGPDGTSQMFDLVEQAPVMAAIPQKSRILFSPDARRALLIDIVWKLIDLDKFEEIGPKHDRDWPLKKAAFNHDGTTLAIQWAADDPVAELWNPLGVHYFPGRARFLGFSGRWELLLSSDGTLAAVTSNSVILWKIPDNMPLPGRIQPVSGNITCAAFHPDGSHVAVATKAGVDLYDTKGTLVGPYLPVKEARSILFSPDGRQVATIDPSGARLWDALLRRPVPLPWQLLQDVKRIQFRPDGREILTASDGDTRLWLNPIVTANERSNAIFRWAQATTGAELDESGILHRLDETERGERRRRFAKLAGLP